jgi:hypothetical protein
MTPWDEPERVPILTRILSRIDTTAIVSAESEGFVDAGSGNVKDP